MYIVSSLFCTPVRVVEQGLESIKEDLTPWLSVHTVDIELIEALRKQR